MPGGTRTFGLRETLLEPQALPPPPTRHALLAFVLALAAVLHIGTAGWSDIHNGPEGYYAGSARERFDGMAKPEQRDPPLLQWLLIGSYASLGPTASAARLPIALATMAAIAFTFLIGERLGGFWRGFVAALIHLCSLGTFVWGRLVTPDPVFAAFLGAAIFCGVCGYQRQQQRRFWFRCCAFCAGLICLTRGLVGVVYLASIFVLLAIFFREARLRFRLLLHWQCLLIFLAVVMPWPLSRFLGGGADADLSAAWSWLVPDFAERSSGLPLWRFLLQQSAWWFPGVALVVPGVCFAWRQIVRPHEFDLADALPLCWIAIGFTPLLFMNGREDHHSIAMWSGFALWCACAWDRTPQHLRIAGLALVALLVVSAIVVAIAGMRPAFFRGAAAWNAVRWMIVLLSVLLLISAAAAAYFVRREREKLAIAILFLTMVPVGLGVAEGMVRFDAHFSLARAASFLETRLGERGEVLYEGAAADGSSLRFYLGRPFTLVDEPAAIERLSAAHPVYLIIHQDRVPFWQRRLTQEFHIYHQETTCGEHVVLSNQP